MTTWTPVELKEFDSLTRRISAPGMGNMDRPIARSELRAFVAKHGKEKCDAMFAELTKGERE